MSRSNMFCRASKNLRVAITLLIACGLLLSSTPAFATYGSAAGAAQNGDSGYDYRFSIDWLKINYQRSKNGDNDWMVYEVRVLRGQNQIFDDKRDGQLTMDKPLTSIQSGDYIALTDQQHRWSNPFVIDTKLQDSDVVIGTFTIVNQSHENHDPDMQRKKWTKFVDTEDKSVTLAKLIALPIGGAGPLVGEIGDIYVGILKAVGIVWDLVSPPLGHDVNCDGPVLSGYWKLTGADLLRRTNNQRRTYNFSVHDTSSDKPASECGHPPDTEVGISIVNQGFVGTFGSGPSPSVKTTHTPVTGGPAGAWDGEWVEHVLVRNSKYDVWIGAMPRPRLGPIPRVPSYQVTVRELAAPGSTQVVFQTAAQGLTAAPAQLPTLRRQVGLLNRFDYSPSAMAFNNPEPLIQGPRTGLVSADALQVGNGVTLYLYAIYDNNNRLLNYAVRYFRQGAADVILQPAQKPLQ
jgi:hypothetical protein